MSPSWKPDPDDRVDRETLTRAFAGPTVESESPGERVGHVYQRVKLSAENAVTVRMLVDTGS